MANNVLTDVIKEVSVAMLPLEMVTDKASTVRLFAKLGYSLPDTNAFTALPGPLIAKISPIITGITDLVNAATNADRLQKAIALGGQIASLADEIGKIKAALAAVGPLAAFANSPNIDELPRRLFDYLIATYLKTTYPGPYSFYAVAGHGG